jgi:hypothetical protein
MKETAERLQREAHSRLGGGSTWPIVEQPMIPQGPCCRQPESQTLLQDFPRRFRQIEAKQPYRFQTTISRCRNAFEAVAAEVSSQ